MLFTVFRFLSCDAVQPVNTVLCLCVVSLGKMPTVVSPELYRARFCEAMDKYFLMVPDHWTGLGINC